LWKHNPGTGFLSITPRYNPAMSNKWLRSWGPALFLMAVIFAVSSRPSNELPYFGGWDYLVKKGGHALGYGLLALAYWRGLNMERNNKWIAWGLAVGYAITDEFHQSYVPGRHPSVFDVIIFDNLGAAIGLILMDRFARKR
jgi:VanZ family protein